MTERLVYRVPEVCAMLGISRATLYRRVKTGEIVIHKLGSITLVKRASLEKMFNALIAVPPDATPDLARDAARQAETD
jgi:excisionase family DNA binding protein